MRSDQAISRPSLISYESSSAASSKSIHGVTFLLKNLWMRDWIAECDNFFCNKMLKKVHSL